MSVDPNAPAHPCRPSEAHKGLTIRQAYAMAAMQGMIADPAMDDGFCQIAFLSFQMADALIAFENQEGE